MTAGALFCLEFMVYGLEVRGGLLALAEDGGADADVGGATGYGGGIVATHAHGENVASCFRHALPKSRVTHSETSRYSSCC